MSKVLCTLELAKRNFQEVKITLMLYAEDFNVSLESREKHGALTDCYLLMRVYFELMGGKQRVSIIYGNSKGENRNKNN